MPDTRMSVSEREAFLAGLHVGVLCLPRASGPPLAAPIWYDYQAGGDIWLVTGGQSQKGRLLEVGGSVCLVAQQEALPYAYVSVEGTVTEIRPCDVDADTRPMAKRYLGEQMGDAYADANAGNGSIRVTIRPDRWLTVDYAKAGLGAE